MMKCNNCGAQLNGTETVCPYCGKSPGFEMVQNANNSLSNSESSLVQNQQDGKVQDKINRKANNNSKVKKNILLIVAGIIIIALITLCIYLFVAKNNQGLFNNDINEENSNTSNINENTTLLSCTRKNNVLDAQYKLNFINDELKNYSLLYSLYNLDESNMTSEEAEDFISYAFLYPTLAQYKEENGVSLNIKELDNKIEVDFNVNLTEASENVMSELLKDFNNKGLDDIKAKITSDGYICQ